MASSYLYTKSEAAFRLAYRQLVRETGERGLKLFFWTFTAECAESDRSFARAWNLFARRWKYILRYDFAALRVFQRHEGGGERSGRLHCHMVCNQRLSVAELRRYACLSGIGQVMKVVRCRPDHEDYMARYMSRSFNLWGVRCWAVLGDLDYCRKNEVRIESKEADFFRACYQLTGEWGRARVLADRFGLWRRLAGEVTIGNFREKVARDLEWADLREALKGWPTFGANNEVILGG